MELHKELIDDIDDLLKKLLKDGDFHVTHSTTELRKKSIRLCDSLNLIRLKSQEIYELDEKGVFAIDDGGIKKYLSRIKSDKDLDTTIKQLTSRRLKYDVLYNIMYVVIGGVIGICTAVVVQYNKGQEIERLHKSAYELNDKHDSLKIGLQQMHSETTSLKKQVDSLKRAWE